MPQTPSLWRWWPGPVGAWLLGMVAQLQQAARMAPSRWPWFALAAALGLALALWGWTRARSAWARCLWGLCLCVACGGAGFMVAEGQAQRRGPGWPAELEGVDLTVTVQVQGLVQRTPSGWRARVQVQTWYDANTGAWQPWPAHWPQDALVSAHGHGVDDPQPWTLDLPAPGELWRWRVRWGAVHGLRNPGGFDHELWMWSQGLRAQGRLRLGPREPAPQRLATGQGAPLEALRQAVRERLLRHVAASNEPFDTPDDASERAAVAGVLAALVVGDQAAIARRSWDDFRATGVAHLMSISGLHITLLGSLGGWLCAAPAHGVDAAVFHRLAGEPGTLAGAPGLEFGGAVGARPGPLGRAATGLLAEFCGGRGLDGQ